MLANIYPFLSYKKIYFNHLTSFSFGEDFDFIFDTFIIISLTISFGLAHKILNDYVFTPLSLYIPKPADKKKHDRPPSPPSSPSLSGSHHQRSARTTVESKAAIKEYEAKVSKFKIACFRFFGYGLLFSTGIYAIYMDNLMDREAKGQGWVDRGMESIFSDWPNHRLHGNVLGYFRSGTNLNPEPVSNIDGALDFDANGEKIVNVVMADSVLLLHYFIGSAFYFYGTVTLLLGTDGTPKSDFTQMFVHHCVTLFLIGFSWYWKLAKYGSIILILHDMSDPFMEIAKTFLYCGKQFLADVFFGLFAFVFVFSRCVVFPRYVIYPLWAYCMTEEGHKKASIVPFAGLGFLCLITLQVLHIIWSSLILRMVYGALVGGKVGDDIREEQSESLSKSE